MSTARSDVDNLICEITRIRDDIDDANRELGLLVRQFAEKARASQGPETATP